MSWKDYPALSERCYLETLPNGLRLRVVPKPGFAGKFAFLGVNFGSCDTQLPQSGGWQTVPDGTAHFLEHRMFCLPDCDPETEFSRLGAETNAFTDYAMTAYYFTCTEHFEDCLRLLLRMVSTPCFPPEVMVDERAVIADEIALYDDSPEDCVQERLCRALYRRHPIRIPIAGSRRSIRAVTPELLRRCFDAYYVPSNMALIVMGDVDAEAVSRLAREVLPPDFSPPPARPCGEAEPARAFRHRTRRTLPVSQPVFAIGFKTAPSADPLRQELTGELIEYQLCQEAARRLAKRYIGRDVFVRGPEEREPDTTYRRRHEPEELLDAYLAAAGRGRRKLPPPAKAFSGIVSRTIVSVSSRITYVLGRLYQGRQVTCRTLHEASRSRSEMVATFLALLELIKDKRIWVKGEEADQQVRMRRADEAEDEEPEEENTIGN